MKKKEFKMPTAYTILFALLVVVAVATWIVPAGQYDYGADGTPVAGSYHSVEQTPQGIGDIVLASFEGFYDAVDVAVFILMVGGFLGVVMETGAIDAGVSNVIRILKGREKLLIPILMVLFGLGGTSFGMWEETMAFYPLLIPVFIAAGYDAVVGISVILLGAGTGVLCSTVNPFATGIAAGFAGVTLGEGIVMRIMMLIVFEAVAIYFVMRYAAKVKADPSRSLVGVGHELFHTAEGEAPPLTGKRKIALTIFAIVFIIMIYGVIPFADMGITAIPTMGWWFPELSGLFLVGGIIIGLFFGLGEEKIAERFVVGAADLLGVAFIIGISRGITVLMNNGSITDTVLNAGEKALTGNGSLAFIILAYIIYLPLSILIPSSSGLATLSIPIMAPLAQFAGLGGDMVVTAFQSASGLVNIVTPTSAVVMGALALARISYDKWLKYVWPLLLIFFVLTLLFLALGAWI